jgi:hypothetical protein
MVTLSVSAEGTRFPNGTLLTNAAWVFGDDGAAAEQTTRICNGPAIECNL